AKVTVRDKGRGAFELDSAIPDCDALITDQAGLWLLSFYADCVPVCFFDPVRRAIGVAHCGWKGTMDRIAHKTLSHMQVEYGTSPDQVRVFIGPGIGPCCFVIQADLKNKVEAEFRGWHDIMTFDAEGKITWNLPETNRRMLIAGGVRIDNIIMCEVCTACNPQIFYSYRKEQGRTGRMGALLGLKY
ncbi:MAG: polyphenol oxidase family protein, partial [Syntrophomonadaceae bacterium]|nr:polyphenol oxidase family protein [Syntrophomonadaceae bacterium]